MPSRPSNTVSGVAGFVLLALLTIAVYLPGISNNTLLDDAYLARHFLAGDTAWRDAALMSELGPLGRPVSMWSFRESARFSPSISHWKQLNLVLHVLCGLMVFCVCAQLKPTVQAQRDGPGAALLISGLWLLHPLLVSTTLYTYQRQTQLATLFALAALAVYLYARRRLQAGDRFIVPLATTGALTLLATLSKENGLLVLAYIALIEVTVLAGTPLSRPQLRQLLVMMAAVCAPVAAIFLTQSQGSVMEFYEQRDYGVAERLMTQARVLFDYIGMSLLPRVQHMDFYHNEFAISRGLLNPPTTLISIILLTILGAGAVLLRRRWPLVALGIGIFLVGHSLESTIFPVELMFEHRNYLPLSGLLIAAIAAAGALPLSGRVRYAAGGATLLVLALACLARTTQWGSTEFHAELFRLNPDATRARVSYAEHLAVSPAGAEQALLLLRAAPDNETRFAAVRMTCRWSGQAAPEWSVLKHDLAAWPYLSHYAGAAILTLADTHLQGRCVLPGISGFVAEAAALPSTSSRRFLTFIALARIRQADGRHAAAREALLLATEVRDDEAMAWFIAAEWSLDQGQPDQALQDFLSGQAIDGALADRFSGLETAIRAGGWPAE